MYLFWGFLERETKNKRQPLETSTESIWPKKNLFSWKYALKTSIKFKMFNYLNVLFQGQAAAGRRCQIQPVQTAPGPAEWGAGAPGQPAAVPGGGDCHSGQTLHPAPERQLPASQELLLRWERQARAEPSSAHTRRPYLLLSSTLRSRLSHKPVSNDLVLKLGDQYSLNEFLLVSSTQQESNIKSSAVGSVWPSLKLNTLI